MFIETERLILKPITADDYEDQCALWSDPDYVQFISGKPMNPETVWLRLLRDLGHWQVFGHGNWSVRPKTTGEHIGTVGIFDYKRDITPPISAMEVGWGLSPAWQGQGLAAEALRAILAYADEGLKLTRLQCIISPTNTPSLKLAEKLGFTIVGNVVYHDDNIHLLERLRP
ncbi:MAG: GNAT family N-acetyltransferase [Asticcacaulis sp.]|uniref:GNAT family N-acetyltransferase n=1 Tax=Asticcacaulis sp. TaxID=1872648 RepID=UPI0039E5B001